MGTKCSGEPSAKQDLETIRFCVFAAPGLHRAQTLLSGAIATFEREQIELEECLPKFVLGFAAVELYNREVVFGKLLENFEDGQKLFFVFWREAC